MKNIGNDFSTLAINFFQFVKSSKKIQILKCKWINLLPNLS